MTVVVPKNTPIEYCLNSSYVLFEQLAEGSRDWEFDFRQLDAPTGPFWLQQLFTPEMHYTRIGLGSHFYQRGRSTTQFRSFALRTNNSSDCKWNGTSIERDCLVINPEAGAFEGLSCPGFDAFALSLSNELLKSTAETEFQRPLADFLDPDGKVLSQIGYPLKELRSILHLLSRAVRLGADHVVALHGNAGLNRLEHNLAHLILCCLDQGKTRSPAKSPKTRTLALRRTLDIIDQSHTSQLCAADLSAQAGVSRRTLEYAFQDGLGVSPAIYLKAVRLRALHRELLACGTEHTSVSELCNRHGFTHAGKLALDYRGLFGELPSATLRRGHPLRRWIA